MRIGKNILSISLLVASFAWTLWFVFAGFGNHQDPLYWLYKYEHLEGGWMAMGTLLAGGGIVRLFGAQLLPLRIAGWLCVVAAIALPYCSLLNKEQRRDNLHWLALAYVFTGYGAFQEFSPGTLSVLLLSVLWVVCARYQSSIPNHPSSVTIVLIGILMGLAVVVRFPNILVLPVVLLALSGKETIIRRMESRTRFIAFGTAVIAAGVVYMIGYLMLHQAPIDASMNSHEIRNMFFKLWENGGKLVGYMLLAIGVMAIGKSIVESQKSRVESRESKVYSQMLVILGLLVGGVLVYFIAYTIKPIQWYNIDLTYFLSAFCMVIALVAGSTTNPSILLGIAILMIATLGTDTAWLKLFPAVLCLLPVSAVLFDKELKRYLWPVLAVMSIIVVVRFSTNSVGQTNLVQARTLTSLSPYKHIAIRESEQEWLQQVKADYDSLVVESRKSTDESSIIAIGQQNHLMRAVTGCDAAKYNEFWSNIYDSVYTAKYRDIICAERPIVFCSFSPQFKTKPIYKDRQSALENMLREERYREIDRSRYKYMIYVPDERMKE